MPIHGHGTITHGKTKSTNKVKNTLKQIICCFLYLTHIYIFEVSRFEVSQVFLGFVFKTSRFACDGDWKVCKTKEPLKVLFSSGIRDTKFTTFRLISVIRLETNAIMAGGA